MKPKREIMNMPDMAKWKRSAVRPEADHWSLVDRGRLISFVTVFLKAYTEYINFIQNLNDSVKGTTLDPEGAQAPNLPAVSERERACGEFCGELTAIFSRRL